jgi:hypothetical protein
LTKKEKKEFDYYTEEELAFACFVRYKRWVYDLGEFSMIRSPGSSIYPNDHIVHEVNNPLRHWHGIHHESYFSGVLIRYADKDCDHVVVGRYYC